MEGISGSVFMEAAEIQRHEQTLSEVAHEELERAAGNVARAAVNVCERLRESPHLLMALVNEYLVEVEANRRIAYRASIRRYSNAVAKDDSHRVMALARGNLRMLMDYPLPDKGTRLKDATKDQLRKFSEDQYRKGQTMCWDAKWYALIADRLPDDLKRVRDVLEETDLQKLREKAKHAKR
jgi:hypothetical protein